jgi:prepilin peptidase CpaA
VMFLSDVIAICRSMFNPRRLPPAAAFYRVSMFDNYLLIGAVLVAFVGGASDLRSARIPNWLTYSGVLAALLVRFSMVGWSGLKSGIAGTLVAGVVFFLLFVMGAMGGGDVKLMTAVGAWSGQDHVLSVLIAVALAGGLLAIIYILFGHGLRETVWNIVELIRFRLTSGLLPHPVLNVRRPGTLHVPFGVAIAMGTLFSAGNAIWWR